MTGALPQLLENQIPFSIFIRLLPNELDLRITTFCRRFRGRHPRSCSSLHSNPGGRRLAKAAISAGPHFRVLSRPWCLNGTVLLQRKPLQLTLLFSLPILSLSISSLHNMHITNMCIAVSHIHVCQSFSGT